MNRRETIVYLVTLMLVMSGCAAPTLSTAAVTDTPLTLQSTALLPTAISTSAEIPIVEVTPTQTATPTATAAPAQYPHAAKATASPAATSASTTTPTAGQTIAPTPVVRVKLTVDPVNVHTGDTIHVHWETTGNEGPEGSAFIWLIPEGVTHGQMEHEWQDLPVNGDVQFTADGADRERYWLQISVYNSTTGGEASDEVEIRYPCPDTYFFAVSNDSCPAGPVEYPQAAQQDFEGGRMIWLASTNYIYVLHTGGGSFYSGGWLGRYPNPWSSGDPESDPSITPPDGRYQPLRGFGKVWRDNTRVRDALGWALAPEQGFTSAYQKEFLTCQVHPTGCDGWVPPEYLRLADGRIIALSFTVQHGYVPSWGYVNP